MGETGNRSVSRGRVLVSRLGQSVYTRSCTGEAVQGVGEGHSGSGSHTVEF